MMAKTRKASAQQLFKQYLKLEKAKSVVAVESRELRELAVTNEHLSELVEHDGFVFRVSTGGRDWLNAKVDVERVAAVSDLERVIK